LCNYASAGIGVVEHNTSSALQLAADRRSGYAAQMNADLLFHSGEQQQ
jgi:hypothetical protein